MTAEEAIHEIDSCYGPCGNMCASCRSAYHLKEYRDVIAGLLEELEKYKAVVDLATDINGFYEILDANGIVL